MKLEMKATQAIHRERNLCNGNDSTMTERALVLSTTSSVSHAAQLTPVTYRSLAFCFHATTAGAPHKITANKQNSLQLANRKEKKLQLMKIRITMTTTTITMTARAHVTTQFSITDMKTARTRGVHPFK